jgi:hypothetical protein
MSIEYIKHGKAHDPVNSGGIHMQTAKSLANMPRLESETMRIASWLSAMSGQ